MSFDLVPDDLVLKIFHQLPFKDRVRLSGVNRLFKDVSIRSINKMKSLSLNNDQDLATYSIRSMQSFTYLLESCSSTLESIDASNWKCNKTLLDCLVEFVYPKMKHLKIAIISNHHTPLDFSTVIKWNRQTKNLLSRCRNLRSIILELTDAFQWPENFVFENLENMEIYKHCYENIYLSSILRPLIGNVPNLKRLSVRSWPMREILSVQEFTQLLASTPYLQELDLNLSSGSYIEVTVPEGLFVNMVQDFVAAIPTWRLPFLTKLSIDLKTWDYKIPSSILHKFSSSFPLLKSFESDMIKEIDDLAIVELSQLTHMQTLRLPNLDMAIDKFTEMITSMPYMEILEISLSGNNDEVVQALSQLAYLRESYLELGDMTKAELIDLITNVPSICELEISEISDAHSPEEFIDFLTSTTNLFHRYLKIRLTSMYISIESDLESELEFDQMIASLEEIRASGGPMVEMEHKCALVTSIHY